MVTTLALIAVFGLQTEGVNVKFIGSGVTARVGGYRPLRAEMDGKPELIKKAPDGITAPKYGTIEIGDKSWAFLLDEPADQPAKLYVDTNGDGDLTNDPATSWSAQKTGELTMHQGKSQVDLGNGQLGSLGMYRFDPKDTRRASLKNTLMFYTDFGYELTVSLDGQAFSTFASGAIDNSTSLWIDRDRNNLKSYKREMVRVGQPFNFTGTTYLLSIKDGVPTLETATEPLPMAPLPPNLAVGQKAIAFTAKATDGETVDFPKAYAGKLVMLDFWATWCGPCIAELPNVKKAYADWHDQGFEVLGISFDNQGMDKKLADFTQEHEMPWRQVYEGKGWNTELGDLYDVSAIPFVLLVDGDSGEILATARNLRGPGLSEYIGKALEKKKSGAE